MSLLMLLIFLMMVSETEIRHVQCIEECVLDEVCQVSVETVYRVCA